MTTVTVVVEGRRLRLAKLDKPLWPDGSTKRQLVDYYARIAPRCCRTFVSGGTDGCHSVRRWTIEVIDKESTPLPTVELFRDDDN